MTSSIGRISRYAALAAVAGTGLLQAGQHATFHLPVAAHWGSIVLQPGDYSMTLPDNSIGERMFRVENDEGKTIRELPLVTSSQENSNASRLKLQEIDGNYFVREFSSGPAGKSFLFSVPKANHRQQMATVININSGTTE